MVLEQVGLSAADAQRLPREFSGGERQRIAIARALITEPAVIAFDEAVSALDVLIRAQILKLLADLAERLKVAYLFVSHDLHVIRAIADRVYVMQQGRIVEEGPADAVFDVAAARIHPSADCRYAELRRQNVTAPRLAAAKLIRLNRRARAGLKTRVAAAASCTGAAAPCSGWSARPPPRRSHGWRLHGLLCAGLAAVASAVLIARRRALKRAEFASSWLAAVPVSASTARWESLLIETLPAIAAIGLLTIAAIATLMLSFARSSELFAPLALWAYL